MSVSQILEIGLGIVMLAVAFLAIESKKILNGIIFLSLLSVLSVMGFVIMQAPDVAITEAVIGSGLVTALFLFTLLAIRKCTEKESE